MLLGDVGHGRGHLQPAEILAERRLLLVGQRLAGEHQHAVLRHARVELLRHARRQRPGGVDAGDLAREGRGQAPDLHAHCAASASSTAISGVRFTFIVSQPSMRMRRVADIRRGACTSPTS